jgi:hypothetical protein
MITKYLQLFEKLIIFFTTLSIRCVKYMLIIILSLLSMYTRVLYLIAKANCNERLIVVHVKFFEMLERLFSKKLCYKTYKKLGQRMRG